MTEALKNKAIVLADKAIDLSLDYLATCARIEVLLEKFSTVEINEAFYQPGDGIVISFLSAGSIDGSVPIREFLERYVK